MTSFTREIARLTKLFGNSEKTAVFLSALKNLETLDSDEKHNRFSFIRSNSNWASSLVTELTKVLATIDTEENLQQKLPRIMRICQRYQTIPEVTYPWLKALGLLFFSALGLISMGLIAVPFGAMVGAIKLPAELGPDFLAGVLGSPDFAFACIVSSGGSILILLAVIILASTLILAACGTIVGAGSALGIGAQVGCEVGSNCIGTDYAGIQNTLFFRKEHTDLSDRALEIGQASQNMLEVCAI